MVPKYMILKTLRIWIDTILKYLYSAKSRCNQKCGGVFGTYFKNHFK